VVLLLAGSALAAPGAAPAPAPDAGAPAAQNVSVVTASRGSPIGGASQASSVLFERDIAQLPAQTTDDVLRGQAGVELPRGDSRALHPTGQHVSMRGLGGGRTLVLLDGVPLNDPFGGWIQWNKVAKSQIARVEIVRGASSDVYGSLAMGGVIQVFTRPVSDRAAVVQGDDGSRDSLHAAAFASTPLGKGFAVGASADATHTDGYLSLAPEDRGPLDAPTAYQSQNAALHASWTHGAWQTRADATYFGDRQDLGTPLAVNTRQMADGALGATAKLGGGTLALSAFGGHQVLHNENTRVDAARDGETPSLVQRIPVDHLGGSVVWTQPLGARQDLVAGLDLRWVQATNFEDVYDRAGALTGSRAAGGQQAEGGLFAQWSGTPWRWLTLSAGLRGDGWLNFAGTQRAVDGQDAPLASRRAGAVSPRVDVIVRPSSRLAVRGAAYTGFRAPNLNELYRGYFSNGVQVAPNPDLGPERLVGGELGIDGAPSSHTRLAVTGFLDRTDGLIEQVTLDADTRQRQNIAQAMSAGAEIEASWHPTYRLRLVATYTLTFSRILKFPADASLQDKALAETPRHAGALTAALRLPARFAADLRVRAESAQFADDQNTLALPAFALVDLTVSRQVFDHVTLFAKVSNLLDTTVVIDRTQSLTRVGAPRTLWGGFRARF